MNKTCLILVLVLFLTTSTMNLTESINAEASILSNLEQLSTTEYDRWAILVCGSDDYSVGFQNDIEDMYLMLKNELEYDDDHIYYVAPNQWNYEGAHYYSLSKANVFSAIQGVASRSESDDTVFFYYTAHGWDGWLDANGDRNVDTTIPSDDVYVEDLDTWLDEIDPPYYLTPRKCQQMVILIQSSRSGSLLYQLSYNEAAPEWMPHLNRIVITSTDATTSSWEDMGVYGDPSWDPNRVDDDGNTVNGDNDGSEFSSGFRQAFRNIDGDSYAEADELTYPGGTFFPSGFTGGNQDDKISVLEAFNYTDYMCCWTKRYDNPQSQAEVPGWIAVYPQIWTALYDGYLDGIDPSTTYLQEVISPTLDVDSDGLSESTEEKLGTNPYDSHDPGIYCLYVNTMMTRDYFCWENIGGIDIALERLDHTNAAVIIRRGTTFNIGGPSTATMTITKSTPELTTLSPTKTDSNWQISIGNTNTVGKYTLTLTDGAWSKSMDLYVIFDLPTISLGDDRETLTEQGLKGYLYDENSIRDDISVVWFAIEGIDYYDGTWHSQFAAGRFDNRQYERRVLDEVMLAVNGENTQWDAAQAILTYMTQIKNFTCPNPYFDMHDWLDGTSIYGNSEAECSAFGAATTSFLRSVGIPARPVVVDHHAPGGLPMNFDHSTELWVSNPQNSGSQWYVMQGYSPGWGIQTRAWWYGKDRLMVIAGPDLGVSHLDKARGVGTSMIWLTENEVGGDITDGYYDYHHRYDEDGEDDDGNDPGWIDRRYWVLTENGIYWGTNEPTTTVPIWGDEPGDPASRDFNLVANAPTSITIEQGEEASFSISLSSTNGYEELPIVLELQGFTGCYKFEYVWQGTSTDIIRENRIAPLIWGYNWQVPPAGSANEDLKLTIKTTSSTPTGDYTLTIKGTGRDGKSHTTTVTLTITPTTGEHSLSIDAIYVYKLVTHDSISYFSITVVNDGDFSETFDADCYYDSNLIETKTVGPGSPFKSLEPGESIIIPFRWDTTPVPKGNYTITATVSNQYCQSSSSYSHVYEVILGDINADGTINILDIAIAAKAYGTSTIIEDINRDGVVDDVDMAIVAWAFGTVPGNPRWNPDADINNNGRVDNVDAATIAGQYGFSADPRWNPDADVDNNGAVNILDIATIAKEYGKAY